MERTIKDLNPKIREWIGSDQVVAVIDELVRKYGVSEKKISVIPRLILRVTLKMTEPQNFTQELAEKLNVSLTAAVAIAEEMKEKIFLPIRKQLADDDTDINLIKTTLPGAGIDHKPAIEYKRPELTPAAAPLPPPPQEKLVARPITEIKPIEPPPATPTRPAEVAAMLAEKIAVAASPVSAGPARGGAGEPAPFVLHEEKESGFQPILETKKVAFTPAGAAFGGAGEAKKTARPVAARLEIGEEADTATKSEAKAEAPKQRVVHYGEFRTPVSPFGQAQGGPFGQTQDKPLGAAQDNPAVVPPAQPVFVPPPSQTPFGTAQGVPQKRTPEKTPDSESEKVVDLAAFRKDREVAVNKNTVDLR
ncbi:MAG: hypothetical protein HZA37_00220 [Parcubacteria group bacterium]|nr:hypothetical protein [Parcubacteria group bacterium]